MKDQLRLIPGALASIFKSSSTLEVKILILRQLFRCTAAKRYDLDSRCDPRAYGADSWSVQAVGIERFSDGAVRLGAPFPCAAINKINKKPLHLNSEASASRRVS